MLAMLSPLLRGEEQDRLKDKLLNAIAENYYRKMNVEDLKEKSLTEIMNGLDEDSKLIKSQTKELDFLRGFKKKKTVSDSRIIDRNIGVIRIEYFAERTDEEFQRTFADLKRQGANRFIIDLRGNSGGDFKSAVALLENFAPEGKVIATLKGRNSVKVYRSANTKPQRIEGMILMDHDTASSAELVAEALRNFQKVKLIGAATRGKHTVQSVISVGDQWLVLTSGTWQFGEDNEPGALTPDFLIEDRKRQLGKAIEILQKP